MGTTKGARRSTPSARRGGLSEADVCAAYGVVLDSLDAGYDAVEWRRRLLKGLSPLVAMDIGMAALMPADPGHHGGVIPLRVYYSDTRDAEERWQRFLARADVPKDPLTPHIMKHWDRPLTARLGDFMDYETWQTLPYAKHVYLAMDFYDIIHSRVPRPDLGQVSILGLTRGRRQPRFSERERRIVEIAHGELVARIAVPSPAATHSYGVLPTRLQELATHLRGPMSEKEIAREMCLSPHTVHNYAKALYRRLGVTSRNEAQHAMKARDGRSGTRNELVLA